MELPLKDFNLIMETKNPENKITFQWTIRNINKLAETISSSKFFLALGKPRDWTVSIFYDKKDDMLLVELGYHGQKDAPSIEVSSCSRILQNEGSVLADDQEYTHVFHGGDKHTLFYLQELVSCDKKFVFQSTMTVHGYGVDCRPQLFNDDSYLREVKKLWKDYVYMLDFGGFTDVNIQIEDLSFSAHKCVLKHLVPKLFREHQEDILKGKFNLDGLVNPKIFNVVLSSIYECKANQHVVVQCWKSFYPVAVKYELKMLLKACRKEMINNMTVDKVRDFCKMANEINDQEMVKYCKGFIKDNVPDWESDDRYKDMMKIDQKLI